MEQFVLMARIQIIACRRWLDDDQTTRSTLKPLLSLGGMVWSRRASRGGMTGQYRCRVRCPRRSKSAFALGEKTTWTRVPRHRHVPRTHFRVRKNSTVLPGRRTQNGVRRRDPDGSCVCGRSCCCGTAGESHRLYPVSAEPGLSPLDLCRMVPKICFRRGMCAA